MFFVLFCLLGAFKLKQQQYLSLEIKLEIIMFSKGSQAQDDEHLVSYMQNLVLKLHVV